MHRRIISVGLCLSGDILLRRCLVYVIELKLLLTILLCSRMKKDSLIFLYKFFDLFILRFYVVFNPFVICSIRKKSYLIAIIISITISLFWTIAPMIGWSYYSLEGALTTCSVEWEDRSFNVVSYNLAMFIGAYFIPLLFMIITTVNIIIKVILNKCLNKAKKY